MCPELTHLATELFMREEGITLYTCLKNNSRSETQTDFQYQDFIPYQMYLKQIVLKYFNLVT